MLETREAQSAVGTAEFYPRPLCNLRQPRLRGPMFNKMWYQMISGSQQSQELSTANPWTRLILTNFSISMTYAPGSQPTVTDLQDSFRTDYAPQLPFLDKLKSPNAQYVSSPFLFWAIIGVGCRTYARNPTLLAVLAPAVLAAALSTLNSPVTLQTIQALLTLLHWPFPKTSATSDLLYPLTGALINMAMQIGLHLPISAQEFSKVRLSLDTTEIERRARTWGFCQLIHLRSGVPKGSPAPAVFDIPYDLDERRIMFDNLSTEQKFQLKLQDIVNRCCIAASQNGLRVMTSDRERSLDTLLAVFSAQIASIGLDASSGKSGLLISAIHAYEPRS